MEPRQSIEKNKIRLYYYIGSISAIMSIVVMISAIYSRSMNQEYQSKIHQLSSGIINEKKRFLKNAVDRTIGMIEYEFGQERQEAPGDDQERIRKRCIERVSRQIRKLRLIDNGYVWVNKIISYDGGDKYAVRLIHPNLPQTEGEWLSTKTVDTMGNRPYQAELDGIKKDGELYFDYYFKKMDSEKIAHKLSYARLYAPLDWVIATGVYLDDVDDLVKAETLKMEKTLKKQTHYSYAFVAMAFLISTFILIRFERQIGSLIQSYERDVQDHTNRILKEKEKTERALAEVRQLRGLLPICSSCKKIRDDQGYWSNLELFIETHSEASFSHGICPDCSEKLYGNQQWYQNMKKKKERNR